MLLCQLTTKQCQYRLMAALPEEIKNTNYFFQLKYFTEHARYGKSQLNFVDIALVFILNFLASSMVTSGLSKLTDFEFQTEGKLSKCCNFDSSRDRGAQLRCEGAWSIREVTCYLESSERRIFSYRCNCYQAVTHIELFSFLFSFAMIIKSVLDTTSISIRELSFLSVRKTVVLFQERSANSKQIVALAISSSYSTV